MTWGSPSRLLLLVALVLAAGACKEDVEIGQTGDGGVGPDGPPAIPGLLSITVTPGDTQIHVDDLAVHQEVPYTAMGSFVDGSMRDVTGEVAWGVDNAAPGDFTATPGLWRSSNGAGGVVVVEARAGGITGTADLTVVFEPNVVDGAFPPPPGSEELFDPSVPRVDGDPNGPSIVYPARETMFPLNVYRILFQYETGTVGDVYQLRFQSAVLDMKVYTTADRWQADAQTWAFLAQSNAGGGVVMTVSAASTASPGTVWRSPPIDLLFSRSAVEGAIYYWSTSSEGVMKGVISEAAPTKFYTAPPDDTCVACHTVSRDGKRLSGGYGGETLVEVSVPGRDVIIPPSRDMGWSTFSPDGELLLIASKGTMTLLDSDSGQPVGPNAGVVPLAGGLGTHPDWSPRGDFVVYAQCVKANNNKDVETCSIARIGYQNGVWGAPEILVPSAAATDNHFFPRYSPDGNWIAYVTAVGKSKDSKSARLMLVDAGGGTPIELPRANTRVGPQDGVIDIGNSMPTWAPTTHPGTQWLAFSSLRAYGKVQVGADQLWVVAIDPARIGVGDPSFAGFWLPLQEVAERNHRAFWAHDAEVPCPGTAEVCDEFDNDCDGVVDEECIPCAAEEQCFDGLDNDCDGEVDEGCIG